MLYIEKRKEMSSNREKLVDFLSVHLEGLSEDGWYGTQPNIKCFDLYGHDYLGFAEYELEQYNLTSDEHVLPT